MNLMLGDCLERLKELPDNSIDSIVTDPPYGLGKEPDVAEVMKSWIECGHHDIKGAGFMGKTWDAFVPQPVLWKEVYRVLKPGGHILVFSGTRTYDWMVMSIRFAGFEIRDRIQYLFDDSEIRDGFLESLNIEQREMLGQILKSGKNEVCWCYGSGFPKSLDISKAIDKQGGKSLGWFIEYILKIADERGISKKQLTMLFPSKNGKATGWLYNKQETQNITVEQYNKIREFLQLPFESIEEAEREVVGKKQSGLGSGKTYAFTDSNGQSNKEIDGTVPSTFSAKQWSGWGTALKPANEPILLARKPLSEKTVAENVLKYGTGGINIDESRIGLSGEKPPIGSAKRVYKSNLYTEEKIYGDNKETSPLGRFPANLILSHSDGCKCVGVKKVKSDGHHSYKLPDDGGLYKLGLNNMGDKGNPHADENGMETVESWECVDGCPVKMMDEQSGIRPSFTGNGNAEIGVATNGQGVPPLRRGTGVARYDTGGASRFFYCAKTSKSERNDGCELIEAKKQDESRIEGNPGGDNPRNRGVHIRKNNHPTVKPLKLMKYLVRLITPKNGVCLDPFMGSGSTGVACILEGFDFVGIEMQEDYFKIAEARINHAEDDGIEDNETDVNNHEKPKNGDVAVNNQMELEL